MTRLPDIETNDIDLAAVYMVATDRTPNIYREPGDPLVTFQIPQDEKTRKVILEYAAGTLVVNARRFALKRAWLYRKAREVK
jgi:hypothetical protein